MFITDFLTAALVILTGYYAWQTRETVKAMKNSAKLEFMPIISIYGFSAGYNLFILELKNVGRGIAQNIKISFPKQEPFTIDKLSEKESLNKKPINVKDPLEVLRLPKEERVIKIEYCDLFGRKICSSAIILNEAEEGPRKNHLSIGPYSLKLPN